MDTKTTVNLAVVDLIVNNFAIKMLKKGYPKLDIVQDIMTIKGCLNMLVMTICYLPLDDDDKVKVKEILKKDIDSEFDRVMEIVKKGDRVNLTTHTT